MAESLADLCYDFVVTSLTRRQWDLFSAHLDRNLLFYYLNNHAYQDDLGMRTILDSWPGRTLALENNELAQYEHEVLVRLVEFFAQTAKSSRIMSLRTLDLTGCIYLDGYIVNYSSIFDWFIDIPGNNGTEHRKYILYFNMHLFNVRFINSTEIREFLLPGFFDEGYVQFHVEPRKLYLELKIRPRMQLQFDQVTQAVLDQLDDVRLHLCFKGHRNYLNVGCYLIPKFVKLSFLKIKFVDLSDRVENIISKCPNPLRGLHLKNGSLIPGDIADLLRAPLNRLEDLDLSYNDLTDFPIPFLTNLINEIKGTLKYLRLKRCGVNEGMIVPLLRALRECLLLETLNLESNEFDENGQDVVRYIGRMRKDGSLKYAFLSRRTGQQLLQPPPQPNNADEEN